MGFGLLYQIIPGFYIFNELDLISPFWLLEIIYYVLHLSICSLAVLWFLFSVVKTTTHDQDDVLHCAGETCGYTAISLCIRQ